MTEKVLSSLLLLLSQVDDDLCSGSSDGDREIGLEAGGSLLRSNGFLMYFGLRSILPRPGMDSRLGSGSSLSIGAGSFST